MKILSKLIILLSVVLNSIHLILPFSGFTLNINYSPLLSFVGIILLSLIFHIYSNFRNDWKYLFVIYFSFIAQNISYQVNSGVPDYINLYLLKSNIPDFLICSSILTWWYFRVYKSQINVATKVVQ